MAGLKRDALGVIALRAVMPTYYQSLAGKEGVKMRRLMIPVALVLVVGLGSYAIFAQQQPPDQPQQGMMGGGMGGGMMQGQGGMMGRGMMQGQGGMMGRGMMQQGGMGCPGCAAVCGGMMQESVTATTDGGVVVVVAGKLIKYDSGLNKVKEVTLDIDWTKMHQMAQQMMQNCPMTQQMMKQQTGQPQGRQTQ